MSAHMFPCDNKTFLIAVHTTWDVQTLYFKNREGKLHLSSQSQNFARVNADRIHLFIGSTNKIQKPADKLGEFEIRFSNLVGLLKEGQKHCSMGLCGLISLLSIWRSI